MQEAHIQPALGGNTSDCSQIGQTPDGNPSGRRSPCSFLCWSDAKRVAVRSPSTGFHFTIWGCGEGISVGKKLEISDLCIGCARRINVAKRFLPEDRRDFEGSRLARRLPPGGSKGERIRREMRLGGIAEPGVDGLRISRDNDRLSRRSIGSTEGKRPGGAGGLRFLHRRLGKGHVSEQASLAFIQLVIAELTASPPFSAATIAGAHPGHAE